MPFPSPASSSHSLSCSLEGKTILQIIPQLETGGAERTTIDISAAIAEEGGRALVATAGGRLVSELHAKGGAWIPFQAQTKNPLRMAGNILKLMRLIHYEKVDLVHARSRAPAWSAYAATRLLNVPFVTTYHGIYSARFKTKRYYNSIMVRSDCVIANSQHTASVITSAYPYARERIEIIYCGTDLRLFSPASVTPARVMQLRKGWGLSPEEKIILLPARLTQGKGHRVLIQAAQHMRGSDYKDVKFILAGDAQDRITYVQELESMISSAGLEGIVRCVGHCTDMPAAYLAASIVAAPAIIPESFGRTAVEAQAMGTPVIVSDLGAITETVLAPPRVAESERTGWVVPSGDALALATQLTQVLKLGASQREALAQRARAHVEQCFSLPRTCEKTLALYAKYM